jgi:hypothetical protein
VVAESLNMTVHIIATQFIFNSKYDNLSFCSNLKKLGVKVLTCIMSRKNYGHCSQRSIICSTGSIDPANSISSATFAENRNQWNSINKDWKFMEFH